MAVSMPEDECYASQLCLLLEELCCDLCRFEHVTTDGLAPESVRIDREFYLGAPGAFADIRVAPADRPPYFVEVKYGYSNEVLLRHLRRKYGREAAELRDVSKVVLVIDAEGRPAWPALAEEASRA